MRITTAPACRQAALGARARGAQERPAQRRGGLWLAAALAASCDPAAPRTEWTRVDLWQLAPQVVAQPSPAAAPSELLEVKLSPLAAARTPRGTPEVRVLETRPGVRLAWTLGLGLEPYLSFRPLGDDNAACRLLYRVGVEPSSTELQEIFNTEVAPTSVDPNDSATVEVDLAPWAGQEVRLLVQADALGAGCSAASSEARARWASPALYGRQATSRRRPDSRPHVLLITADTLRADALGAYGRSPSVTPALDGLAAESDVFLQAFSSFNATNPSFASLMTGLYGKNHGVYDLKTPLPEEATTLAELVAKAGYATKSIISVRHLADDFSGLGQGFQETSQARSQYAAELAVDLAIDWVSRQGRQPFFLWLHLFDPHTPHTPPAPFALGYAPRQAAGLAVGRDWQAFRTPGPLAFEEPHLGGHRELYAGEVAYLDRQIDRLLGFLRSRDLLSETLLVFLADHGENLHDHDIHFRHAGLWDTTTHIPLFIRWPEDGGAGRRLSGLVQNVDLFPTILKAVQVEAPPSDGLDLGRGGDTRRRPAVFAEHAEGLGVMIRTQQHLLATSRGSPFLPDGRYFYDLRRDPGQAHNLAGAGDSAESEMYRQLKSWLEERRPLPGSVPRELSEASMQQLRSLGYL